jgi:hypothetical protein
VKLADPPASSVHRDDNRVAPQQSVLVSSQALVQMSQEGAFIAGDSGVASDSIEGVSHEQVEAACEALRIPIVVASITTVASLRRSAFDVRCIYVGLGHLESNVS